MAALSWLHQMQLCTFSLELNSKSKIKLKHTLESSSSFDRLAPFASAMYAILLDNFNSSGVLLEKSKISFQQQNSTSTTIQVRQEVTICNKVSTW